MPMKIGQPEAVEGNQQGKRDAFHVPAVLVRWAGPGLSNVPIPIPGGNVKFVDDRFLEVVNCSEDERHAIIDPFVNAAAIQGNVIFWVLLIPETTAELSHNFKINVPNVAHFEVQEEEEEDEDEYDYDDGCKGCW